MDLSVLIYAAVLCYAVIVVGLLRVAQAIRKKDDLLRAMTQQWIEESSHLSSPTSD